MPPAFPAVASNDLHEAEAEAEDEDNVDMSEDGDGDDDDDEDEDGNSSDDDMTEATTGVAAVVSSAGPHIVAGRDSADLLPVL